ncbi:MAG: response regulator [Alphaproteobacteria bacterium]
MLVITQKAETTFLETLKECWENFPTHRCLHLRISQIEQDTQACCDKTLEALRGFLEDHSAQIYVCHDNDIFVLTRYITRRHVDDFLAFLTPKLKPALSEKTPFGLAYLFEIGVDWPKLRTICKRKIESIQIGIDRQKRLKEKKEKIVAENRNEALGKIDLDLISSLAMRRDQRTQPEIMVVEDDPFSQKLVANALKKQYSLSMTDDGQGAIMNYVHKAPDVLFLDIGLPDMNGHEVLKKLFQIDPGAYIIMFSGNGDKENVMKAIELGAKGFVGKPFTQEKLLQYIQKSPFIQEKQKKETSHVTRVY